MANTKSITLSERSIGITLTLLAGVLLISGMTLAPVGTVNAAGSTDLTVSSETQTLSPDESTTVDVAITNAQDGVGSAEFRVELEDASVASITDVSVGSNPGSENTAIDSDGGGVNVRYAFDDSIDTGTVTIVSITLDAEETGSTAIDIADSNDGVLVVSDEDGATYDLSSIGSASVSVERENTPPTANDLSVTTTEGSDASESFQASDPDGDSLSYSVSNSPAHGSVSITGNEFVYTPDAGYSGSDSFTYRVQDGDDGSDTATVDVTVEQSDVSNDRFEPNDQLDTAEQISRGEDIDSARIVGGDVDVFKQDLSAGETLSASIDFDHDDSDLQLVVGNDDDAEENVYDQSTSTTDGESVSVTAAADEPYYIIIASENNNTADYSLTTSVESSSESGFITGQVRGVLTNSAISGATITVTDSSGETAVQTTTNERGEYTVEVPQGEYTVLVDKNGYETVSTDVRVSSGGTAVSDISLLPLVDDSPSNDEFESNNDFQSATELQPGSYSDLQILTDDEDYFAIGLSEGDSLSTTINFDHAAGDLDLKVYGPEEQLVESSISTSDDESVSVSDIGDSGTYYVRVYGFQDASTSYDLDVAVESSEEPSATISGIVTDLNDVSLSGTTVTLRDETTRETLGTAVTGPDGRYNFTQVPAGDYIVETTYNSETGAAQISTQSDGTYTANVVVTTEVDTEPSLQVNSFTPGDVTLANSERLDVTANIKNTGDISTTQTVELRIEDETVASETVSVDTGQRQSVLFSGIDTSSVGPGSVTYGVYTQEDSQTATLTVEPAGDSVELNADSPESVALGEEFSVTYTLRNTGDTEARGGGIQLTTPERISLSSVSGDGTNSPDRFYTTIIPASESVTTTYTFTVPEDMSTGTVTITAIGALHSQETSTITTVEVTETSGLPTENTSFTDVLSVIEAYNSNGMYNGVEVEFQDVLIVISSYNN